MFEKFKNTGLSLTGYIFIIILSLALVDTTIIFNVFILRQLLGFLYFTVIPGLLIIQILGLHKLEFSKKILLAVGLSISSLMFIGLALNCLYPLIRKPLAYYPILVSLNIFTISLITLVYLRNRKDFDFNTLYNINIDTKNKYTSPIVFPFIFLFLSIFGTYLMNISGNNILLLSMLYLIPVYVAFLVCFRDKISETTYLAAIWAIGLSIALMYGLRSNYVSLSDGCIEYYLFQLTLKSSYWRPLLNSVPPVSNYSVCLSITILPTIYRIICNLQPYYIFKLYYNVILSVVPLVVYIISSKIFTNPRDRFIAAFFFISQYTYISILGWIIFRQIIAILFFALIIFTIFEENLPELIQKSLLIIFIFSVVLSHYSTTYIFFIIFVVYYIFTKIRYLKNIEIYKISVTMTVLTFTLIFFWYGIISISPFKSFINVLETITLRLISVSIETFKTSTNVFIGTSSICYTITKYIYDLSFLFIAVGVLKSIFKTVTNKNKITNTFKLLAYISFGMLSFLVVFGSFLRGKYGYDRVYQQLLVLLSPMFVIGIRSASKRIKIDKKNILLILMITLQFFASTYVIFQIFGVPHSEVLNNNGIRYDIYYIKNVDYACAKWTYTHYCGRLLKIWSDSSGKYIYSQFDPNHARILPTNLKTTRGYFFFRSVDFLNRKIYFFNKIKNIDIYLKYVIKMNKIYNNGAAVYYHI